LANPSSQTEIEILKEGSLRDRIPEVKAIFDEFNISLSKSLEEDLDLCRQATNFGSLIQPHTPLETLETIQNKLTGALGSSDLFPDQ